MCSSVDLPAPFGPSRPVTPGRASNVTSLTATTLPYQRDTGVEHDRGLGRQAVVGGRVPGDRDGSWRAWAQPARSASAHGRAAGSARRARQRGPGQRRRRPRGVRGAGVRTPGRNARSWPSNSRVEPVERRRWAPARASRPTSARRSGHDGSRRPAAVDDEREDAGGRVRRGGPVRRGQAEATEASTAAAQRLSDDRRHRRAAAPATPRRAPRTGPPEQDAQLREQRAGTQHALHQGHELGQRVVRRARAPARSTAADPVALVPADQLRGACAATNSTRNWTISGQ